MELRTGLEEGQVDIRPVLAEVSGIVDIAGEVESVIRRVRPIAVVSVASPKFPVTGEEWDHRSLHHAHLGALRLAVLRMRLRGKRPAGGHGGGLGRCVGGSGGGGGASGGSGGGVGECQSGGNVCGSGHWQGRDSIAGGERGLREGRGCSSSGKRRWRGKERL